MSALMAGASCSMRVLMAPSRRLMADGEAFLAALDPARGPADPPRSVLTTGSLSRQEVRGCRLWRLEPRGARAGEEILFLPGGAYVLPSMRRHWDLLRRIAAATGSAVSLLEYPLAPEHDHRSAAAVIDEAWDRLARRPGMTTMIAAGSSAGGHAALALALRLRGAPERREPDAVIGIAPWTDLMLEHEDTAEAQAEDPALRIAGLQAAARSWAGALRPGDLVVNPLLGPLTGLPPVLLLQGGRDIFRHDTRRFARRAESAGVHVDLIEEPHGFHVYPVLAAAPESRRAMTAIAAHIDAVHRRHDPR